MQYLETQGFWQNKTTEQTSGYIDLLVFLLFSVAESTWIESMSWVGSVPSVVKVWMLHAVANMMLPCLCVRGMMNQWCQNVAKEFHILVKRLGRMNNAINQN